MEEIRHPPTPMALEALYTGRHLTLGECRDPLRTYWASVLVPAEELAQELLSSLRAIIDEKIAAGEVPKSHRGPLFQALERKFRGDFVEELVFAELNSFQPPGT